MNEGPRWRDAEKAALKLGEKDIHLLFILAKLPFLTEKAIEPFSSYSASGSLYRALVRLRNADLVRAIRASSRPGHSPHLWFLSDLGISTVALVQRVEPSALSRRNKIGASDLLALLPGLPQLLATYELLSAVAVSRAERSDLLAWERPWRRSYWRYTAKNPITFQLPAYAIFCWGDETCAYLLVPDLATYPLRLYRVALKHLNRFRSFQNLEPATLVVATVDQHRAAAWADLVKETRHLSEGMPFAATITTWAQLPHGLKELQGFGVGQQFLARSSDPILRLPQLRPSRAGSALPRLVDPILAKPITGAGTLPDESFHPALRLAPADRALLDLVGRHPFLSTEHLAAAFDWSLKWAREKRNHLMAKGLIRKLASNEVGNDFAALELMELTFQGLRLVAAQQGLSLATAVRHNGLVGGGPERPIGSRASLLRQLAHTLGTDGIFIGLIKAAREFVKAGNDDALVEWRSAAACARRCLRPDGYGLYRHAGRLFGFFLEYDRGTLNDTEYLRKFAAYSDHLESGRYRRDYDGFPTILVVTTNNLVEERIARAVGAAGVGRVAKLPLFITWQRLVDDERNPDGLLGRIWREPHLASNERRYWQFKEESLVRTRGG